MSALRSDTQSVPAPVDLLPDSIAGASADPFRAEDVQARLSSTPPQQEAVEQLPSLLRYRQTWEVLAWWTVAYALASWFTAEVFSMFDPAGPTPVLASLNRVVYAVLWSGNILVAIMVTERWPIVSRRQMPRVALHAVLCLAVTVVWGVLAYYICLAIVPGWQPLGVGRMLATTAQNVIFGYGLIVLLVHIIIRVRLHRQQEVTLLRQARLATEVQLQVLKMELQPHFLFNALNSISSLLHSDPSAANDTLVLVSDMLRHTIQTSRVQQVTLRDEIATLKLYTGIEQVRFGDRLELLWEIEPETLDAAVPHLLLQPLIENAIKHGLQVRSDAGRIVVTTRREADTLHLVIEDDGPGLAGPSPMRGAGVGLANTRARLAELYGMAHTFSLSSMAGPRRGAVVDIRIPFQPVSPQTKTSAIESEIVTRNGSRSEKAARASAAVSPGV